jgi:RNA polymerase-binding transcription factor DksA
MSLPERARTRPAPVALDTATLAGLRSRLEDARRFHLAHIAAAEGQEIDDIGTAMAHRSEKALSEVEEALTAFEEGTYGICRHCGEPIPSERLDALPHATSCTRCVGGR